MWHLDATSQVIKSGWHEIMPQLSKDHDSAKYDYLDPDEEQLECEAPESKYSGLQQSINVV